jgi:hypothetical protein
MRPQTILIGSAICAALAFAAPAQAGGFDIGFFLGNGGTSWLPKCTAPEVLTELKDRAGKSQWRCMKPAAATNTQANTARGAAVAQR